jgi:hypothetical protein
VEEIQDVRKKRKEQLTQNTNTSTTPANDPMRTSVPTTINTRNTETSAPRETEIGLRIVGSGGGSDLLIRDRSLDDLDIMSETEVRERVNLNFRQIVIGQAFFVIMLGVGAGSLLLQLSYLYGMILGAVFLGYKYFFYLQQKTKNIR